MWTLRPRRRRLSLYGSLAAQLRRCYIHRYVIPSDGMLLHLWLTLCIDETPNLQQEHAASLSNRLQRLSEILVPPRKAQCNLLVSESTVTVEIIHSKLYSQSSLQRTPRIPANCPPGPN